MKGRYLEDRHRIIRQMIRSVKVHDPEIRWSQIKEMILEMKFEARRSRALILSAKKSKQLELCIDGLMAIYFATSMLYSPITGAIGTSIFGTFVIHDIYALSRMADKLELILKFHADYIIKNHMMNKFDTQLNALSARFHQNADAISTLSKRAEEIATGIPHIIQDASDNSPIVAVGFLQHCRHKPRKKHTLFAENNSPATAENEETEKKTGLAV